MIIAVDFDGTVVTHEYPKIGKCTGAVEVLQELVLEGHKLILLTMRSEQYLADAVRWMQEQGVPLWAVNDNPMQKEWTSSRKVYANLYIDDAALGTPLIAQKKGRPYVDWKAMRCLLRRHGALSKAASCSSCSCIEG